MRGGASVSPAAAEARSSAGASLAALGGDPAELAEHPAQGQGDVAFSGGLRIRDGALDRSCWFLARALAPLRCHGQHCHGQRAVSSSWRSRVASITKR